ncbi:hypothetical protein MTR_7g087420 [Medicago truncatula]|uniref:Uncharacterized protein n=1 Tax=Medicago truncatula TaxID=3880 RepID=G7L2P3_MEDTR|nr:hypothetical protein MTR_7g087420 [Medicago truncatula]
MEGDNDPKKKLLDEEEEELSLVKKMWKESKMMWVVAGPAIFCVLDYKQMGIQKHHCNA